MNIPVLFILIIEFIFALFLLKRSGAIVGARCKLIVVALLLAAFIIRAICLDYKTLDYCDFLSRWVEFYRNNGGFKSFSYPLGNYNIPYMYLLCLFSYSSIDDLYLIKLLSIFFDVLLAYASMRILEKLGKGSVQRLACFFCVLFLPTVILNGSLWAQCDSIYAAFALLAIYYALDERPISSVICFTLSFAFKLQAVFVLPIIAALWFNGRYKFKHLLIFPVFYILLIMPSVLMGKPFSDAFLLYVNQANSVGSALNYNSSSVFAFFTQGGHLSALIHDETLAAQIAIIIAFIYTFTILLLCFIKRRRLSNKSIFIASLLFAVGIPFILPHMHDRYFFLADALTVVFAFTFAKAFFVAPLTQLASLLGYYAYLNMRFLLLMYNGARALVVVIIVCLAVFVRQVFIVDRQLATIEEHK